MQDIGFSSSSSALSLFFVLGLLANRACAYNATNMIEIARREFGYWTVSAVNSLSTNQTLDDFEFGIRANILRGGIMPRVLRWPYNEKAGHYEVPYVVSKDFPADKVEDTVAWAMRLLERGSNIRFVPRTNQFHFIHIVDGDGCFSYLGRQPSGSQKLSLMIGNKLTGTCLTKGVVVHELIHALGIAHEHQRPDRDSWLRMHLENADPRSVEQLTKVPYLDSGKCTPYDYASIMHYEAVAFSRFADSYNKLTMEPTDRRGWLPLTSTKMVPSSCDWVEINSVYPRRGRKFTCEPHKMPNACVPTWCTRTVQGLSCMDYCRSICDNTQCALPEVVELPPSTPLPDVDDYTSMKCAASDSQRLSRVFFSVAMALVTAADFTSR